MTLRTPLLVPRRCCSLCSLPWPRPGRWTRPVHFRPGQAGGGFDLTCSHAGALGRANSSATPCASATCPAALVRRLQRRGGPAPRRSQHHRGSFRRFLLNLAQNCGKFGRCQRERCALAGCHRRRLRCRDRGRELPSNPSGSDRRHQGRPRQGGVWRRWQRRQPRTGRRPQSQPVPQALTPRAYALWRLKAAAKPLRRCRAAMQVYSGDASEAEGRSRLAPRSVLAVLADKRPKVRWAACPPAKEELGYRCGGHHPRLLHGAQASDADFRCGATLLPR